MLLKDTDIYPFIKDKLYKMPILEVKKGDYVSMAVKSDKQLYYILKGDVKILSTSITGKSILVDELSKNEFAGQISSMRKANFHCDILAATDLELLCIRDDIMDTLMQNSDFAALFYYKTSKRIYLMYKKALTNNLFSQREMVAYYIMQESIDGKLVYKSMYRICELLNISRRSLYNVLDYYIEKGVIEREGTSTIMIRDDNYLKDKIVVIKEFLEDAD